MTSKKRSRPSSSLSEEEAHDIPEGNPVLKLIEKFNIYAACKEFLEPAKSEDSGSHSSHNLSEIDKTISDLLDVVCPITKKSLSEDALSISFLNQMVALKCTLKTPSSRYRLDSITEAPPSNQFVATPLRGNVENMSKINEEFKGEQFSHSKTLCATLREAFQLETFRPNQLEIINASLLGHNCFALMPTGGGKSLCFQLPAVMLPGLTVVVCPLKSLIVDQVQKLKSKNIQAEFLSGDNLDKNVVYEELEGEDIDLKLKLLYVTPEKIDKSPSLLHDLTTLYERNRLSQFIIDEAHCVSQWGHDFRLAYKKLSMLKERFPNVPTMALTASATPRVRYDILYQLGLKNTKCFVGNFNRPNLKYAILPKKGKDEMITTLAELISKKFNNESGIIYCLSRHDCETLSIELRRKGILALSYHSNLSNNDRWSRQQEWTDGTLQVLCATTAFGMGIDKPDVRFVIHYSLPNSMEGYYQETGRAGRDGKTAHCYLYYSDRDVSIIQWMIKKNEEKQKAENCDSSSHVFQTQFDNLMKIKGFCENKSDCRRALQLAYFREHFDWKECKATPETTCDNCESHGEYKLEDVTEDCKAIVEAVRASRGNFTLDHFVNIFQTSKVKKNVVQAAQHRPYGHGKQWQRADAERLLDFMVMQHYLDEYFVITSSETTAAYVQLGEKATEILSGKERVQFPKTRFFVKGKQMTKEQPAVAVAENDPDVNRRQ